MTTHAYSLTRENVHLGMPVQVVNSLTGIHEGDTGIVVKYNQGFSGTIIVVQFPDGSVEPYTFSELALLPTTEH